MKHLGDITKIDGSKIEIVDVICGGSPCQDLSVSGKRAGLAGERSGLFMEQIRIVKEMRAHDRATGRADGFVRPRYMVWENVPGAFTSGNPRGADFQSVLQEIVGINYEGQAQPPAIPIPKDGWSTAGALRDGMDGRWSVAWRVHDAQFWGVPQRRKRICVIADFNGLSAPEILFERKGLQWNNSESNRAWKGTPEGFQGSIGEASTSTEAELVAPPPTVEGFDGYNQSMTGSVSKTINSKATDADHVPIVHTPQGFANYNYCVTGDVIATLKARDYKDPFYVMEKK